MAMSRRQHQRILALKDIVTPPSEEELARRRKARLDLRDDFQPPDCLAIAIRYLTEIVASGKSETSRVAAAKLLMEHAGRQAEVANKGQVHVPVIQYVITGDLPPLGEGEYDTSGVDEAGDSDVPDFNVKDCAC
ncbi:hypothetical protein [Asticcacaulis sp. AC402]|uniref:hypothetical protein n=1 Tax=Asticcacaulis sp. AC402 TaxID=1282361 RepID=UPI0003C3C366|nr:hypothetical protein [Asticcacaulis sp. AC402]ESQ73479.1 hypothetical protein ABAC402_19070 [Asticcacaulis sp. AC402]